MRRAPFLVLSGLCFAACAGEATPPDRADADALVTTMTGSSDDSGAVSTAGTAPASAAHEPPSPAAPAGSPPPAASIAASAPDPVTEALRAEAKELNRRGLHAEALERWKRVAEADPGARSWFDLGRALTFASRLDEAEASFRRVLDVRPDHLRTWLNLGNLERRRGRLDASLGWYRRILERDPDYLLAYFNLAEVLEVQGEAELAHGVWLAALERSPRSAAEQSVYNDCVQRAAAAYLQAGEVRRAADLAGRLAEAQPNHPRVHYTLGQAWLTLGDEAKAQAAFERHAALAAAREATAAAASGND